MKGIVEKLRPCTDFISETHQQKYVMFYVVCPN